MKIVELRKGSTRLPKLVYRYTTSHHYALDLKKDAKGWTARLRLRPLPGEIEKDFESEFFQWMVEEPRAFAAVEGGMQVGWIEVGLRSFKDRARIWEFLVLDEYHRRGIGTALMRKAEEVARKAGARMLVLETQRCNVRAIDFYLAYGFELTGFDGATYRNDDVERGEIRLEFGKKLKR